MSNTHMYSKTREKEIKTHTYTWRQGTKQKHKHWLTFFYFTIKSERERERKEKSTNALRKPYGRICLRGSLKNNSVYFILFQFTFCVCVYRDRLLVLLLLFHCQGLTHSFFVSLSLSHSFAIFFNHIVKFCHIIVAVWLLLLFTSSSSSSSMSSLLLSSPSSSR